MKILFAIVLLVAACTGSGSDKFTTSPAPSPTVLAPSPTLQAPSLTPTASATGVISLASPIATAKPLATPPIAMLTDPRGDLVDENDKPKTGPGYQDILATIVKTDSDDTLHVSFQMAGAPPTTWDEVKTQIVFGCFIDTTGDGEPDYEVLLQNVENDTWSGSISEMGTGQTQEGVRFPGAAGVIGDLAFIELPLGDIGSPKAVRIASFTEYENFPDPKNHPLTSIVRKDRAPDNEWPEGSDWIDFAVAQ